ncbi:hypothetical protein ACIPSE_01635 [Streptomyces sp. NPDC090106]|uniref:hypothetical protein n=1 Tax=Streptomyces sp. NPDC090106 TaxID=3365946 RepID=UPI0037FE9380
MDLEKRPPQQQNPEGCLVVAIRIPVRIFVLVLVVPVRVAWDALVVAGKFLGDTVLRPLGRALAWLGRALFVWPLVGLWRYVLVPLGKGLAWLGHVLLVLPAVWLYTYVLAPFGRGVAWLGRGIGAGLAWLYARVLTPFGHGATWLLRCLFVLPAVWVYQWILTPVGHAVVWLLRGIGFCLYWIARVLLVLPAVALWRWVLTPVGRFLAVVGREVGDALGHAWRIAGHISLAVGRLLGTFLRWTLVEPARWTYRTVLTPVGHAVRDTVLRPAAEAARGVGRVTRQALAAARDTARQARADMRRMLFGDLPGERKERVAVARREPSGRETRTLGSSTTALTKD